MSSNEPWTTQLADPAFVRRERFIQWFEAAWNRGERPSIDEFLPADPKDRTSVLIELVHVDMELCRRSGFETSAADYLRRYPGLCDEPGVVESLMAQEGGPGSGESSPVGARIDRPREVARPNVGRLSRFEALEEVGRGAFGVVYRGRDTELDRIVAIKIPRLGISSVEAGSDLDQARERFLREAQSAARLRHPNIVAVHEVGQSGDTVYLVSEFIDGTTLAQLLTAGPLPQRQVIELVKKVAEAIDHAHQKGVIHRDVKPSNILIDRVGQPHVTDFGLAKHDAAEQTLTLEGQVLGTPAYMAPEQARGDGRHVDGRCDIYGLGVVMYQMLTGELPFRGTAQRLLDQVLHDDPRPPRQLNDRVTKDVETICLKAMAKEPDRRYATAAALVDDLKRFQDGRAIKARPIGMLARLWVAARRRPAITSLCLMVALIAAMGFAGVLWQWSRAEAARWRLELNLYARLISLIEAELAAGDTGRAVALLDDCPQWPRCWEWYHLSRRARGDQPLVLNVGERAYGVALSPDNSLLAVALGSGAIQLRETRDPATAFRTLIGHEGPAHDVAFGPAGRWLASAGTDGTVRVWSARGDRLIKTIQAHRNGVWGLDVSPDGRSIATCGNDGAVRIWDTSTWTESRSLRGHQGRVWDVAFSPVGDRLASAGDDGTVQIWDAASGRRLQTASRRPRFPLQSLSISPDGHRVVGGCVDGITAVWNAETGALEREIVTGKHSVWNLTFSPDGRRIATGGERNSVKLWDVQSGQEIITLRGHTEPVWGLRFSRDGASLVSASWDATVRLWESGPSASRSVHILNGHLGPVRSVAYSPDGKRLATASNDGTVRIWDDRSGNLQLTINDNSSGLLCVRYSTDGRWIASCGYDREIKIWNATSGRLIRTLTGHTNTIFDLAFQPGGQQLASASFDGTVRVWDLETGQTIGLFSGHDGYVYCVDYSPDGRLIASGGGDATVRIWDSATSDPIATLPVGDKVRDLAFAPDGSCVAAACWNDRSRVLNLQTGEELFAFGAEGIPITGLAYSPDGSQIATTGWDQAVRLWDATTGQSTGSFTGHLDYVTSLAYRPDGRRLASSSFDRTVRTWPIDPPTNESHAP